MRITVFGDSILKGVTTTPNSGRIFDVTENDSLSIAQRKLGFELDNRSVYGNIITKSKVKFDKYISKVDSGELPKPEICIIESGGNDCDYDWNPVSENPDVPHQPKVPLKEFLETLDVMVKECQKRDIKPVLMTMPALVHERWFETISKNLNRENIMRFIGGNTDKLYRNHEIYNIHLLDYANRNCIQIVDMRLALLETDDYRNYMCMDGIHPNEKGYELMGQVWENFLSHFTQSKQDVAEAGEKISDETAAPTETAASVEKNAPAETAAPVSESEIDEIIIYTDGGCSGNPGPGGWGVVVIAGGVAKQLSGGEALTTNNRMELSAAIAALSVVKNTPSFEGKSVKVNIDSQYVKNGITSWIKGWKAKGWQTADKKPVKNQDLWEKLDALNSSLYVEWNWVKGHAGIEYNEVCDQLCQDEIHKFTKK